MGLMAVPVYSNPVSESSTIVHGWATIFPNQFAGVFVPPPGPVLQTMFTVALSATLGRAAGGKYRGVIAVLADFLLVVASQAERCYAGFIIHAFWRGKAVFIGAMLGRLSVASLTTNPCRHVLLSQGLFLVVHMAHITIGVVGRLDWLGSCRCCWAGSDRWLARL